MRAIDFFQVIEYNQFGSSSEFNVRKFAFGGVVRLELLKKFCNTILFFMKILVIATVTTAFVGVWQNYYGETLYYGRGNYLVIALYTAAFMVFGSIYDGFKVGIMRTNELAYSLSLSVFFSNCFIFVILCLIAGQVLNPIALIVLTVFQIFVLIGLTYALNQIYYALHPTRKVLAIFEPGSRNDIIKKISLIKERFSLTKGITIDRSIDDIKDEIERHDTILICDFDPKLKNEIIKYCYFVNKRIYILPSSTDAILNGSYPVQVSDTPVLFLHKGGFSIEQRIIKRIFDIVVSGLGIIITSPLMLIIAISIKICDRGPIIFKQPRITCNEKVFNIYKFRSMRVADDKEVKKTIVDDDRITFVGRLIRPYRLDELPQLFNILFGHMSVVGPRPEMIELVQEYSEMIPEFNIRHKVKAGLTGYAQIYGKYNTTPQNKLNMDIHYIENYSFLQDIKLFAMTLKILFVKDSTEGFSEADSKLKNTDDGKPS